METATTDLCSPNPTVYILCSFYFQKDYSTGWPPFLFSSSHLIDWFIPFLIPVKCQAWSQTSPHQEAGFLFSELPMSILLLIFVPTFYQLAFSVFPKKNYVSPAQKFWIIGVMELLPILELKGDWLQEVNLCSVFTDAYVECLKGWGDEAWVETHGILPGLWSFW